MRVHLVNPSHVSFGVGVITPRWLFVIAAATPRAFGDPVITDETLEPLDLATVRRGDVVGIGIHTGNALRGYELGRAPRAAGRSPGRRSWTPPSMPATPCAATRSAAPRARLEPPSCSAGSMPRCTRRKRTS